MSNTVSIVPFNKCTGCGACANICPVDAIQMKPDSEGFIMPSIDEKKCINCGKCYAKCPAINPEYPNEPEPECRAVWAKDEIRLTSASGGVFAAFAEIIIKRGGVICGAAYDSDFSVHHIIADDMQGLSAIKSSKYVQSDVENVYRKVKTELDNGREVLFSGCPCQVAGLYAYLGTRDIKKLYTMDLVCHGVPSPKVFRKYIDENFKGKIIEKIDFRDKSYYGWSTEMNVYFNDGKVFRAHHSEDAFYKAFLPCLSLRKSCAQCPFSHIPRQGDLSIGDFWGIDRYDRNLNDKKGTSLLLINNKKGQKMLSEINSVLEKNVVVPVKEALVVNKTITAPFKPHPARRRFFEELDTHNFAQLTQKCLTHHYDIGIVGLWYGLNYGSILTYYALYEVVKSMGYDAIMINKPAEMWAPRYIDRSTIANRFIYEHCNVSNIRNSLNQWREMNDHCDTFIVGSDVVWNYKICGRESKQFFFLDFVDDDKKKIAMASSFGAGYDAPEKERLLSEHFMKKFDYVSVREDEGVNICKEKFNVSADKVMDPVFLCDKNIYHKLADSSLAKRPERYISTYILGPDPHKADILVKTSDKLGIPLINIPNPNVPVKRFTDNMKLPALENPSVEDWLSYIKNSDYFIGDSFHGLCFALIFNKPFLAIINSNISGLCRFTTLLGMLGLEERLIYTDRDNFDDKVYLLDKEIDFEEINKILSEKSGESYLWLKNAITSPKIKQSSVSDILISQLYREISKIKGEIENINRKLPK